MMEPHDPLCPERSERYDEWPWPCMCDLIAKVRADERTRIASEVDRRVEGARGIHRRNWAVEHLLKTARADERERIAQGIETVTVSPNAADDYQLGWTRMRGIAARIARDGGSDESQ